MIDSIKEELKIKLSEYYLNKYNTEINIIVEEPKNKEMGDIAVPLFSVVKVLRAPMPKLVEEAIEAIKNFDLPIVDYKGVGGYVNLVVDKIKLSKDIILSAIKEDSSYGKSNIGNGKNVVLDYSSPNIAKSFSIGHLRSTMIGNSLKLIYQKCGYNTVSINYLGDWGTQFGKMIVAYQKWGNKEIIDQNPIEELTKLYVKFHFEAEANPSLEDDARAAFKKLEEYDNKYMELWSWIREKSLLESKQIYDLLDISFDSYNGEAFYNDKMDNVVNELDQKGLLKLDDGAKIVDLGDDIPPALIKRSDGASLYITRDLAALFYRKNEYKFDKILYVVGNEQKLHFVQLKKLVDKMGYDFSDNIYHINFGLYLTNGKKASTRKGNVVKLYDVLMQAIDEAKKLIEEKNSNLENKDLVAKNVGIAAIVFNDLKNYRELDIEFNIENALKFEGQTGPYLLYCGVRIASILKGKEIDLNVFKSELFNEAHYFELAKLISEFKITIEKASNENSPSVIARYLLNLASSFNRFYSIVKINSDDYEIRNTNFMLIKAVRIVLNEGLRLLGIKYLEEM